VEAVPDRAPVVRLLYPAGDMKIPEENLTLSPRAWTISD
jgi:hypothetical protein